jgi:hypothetical protein
VPSSHTHTHTFLQLLFEDHPLTTRS